MLICSTKNIIGEALISCRACNYMDNAPNNVGQHTHATTPNRVVAQYVCAALDVSSR
jgi:hypothetical protein